jgi:hypothetical protein
MRSFSTLLVVLASCGALVLAAPMPQVLNPDAANERANDGAKVCGLWTGYRPCRGTDPTRQAIENEFKIQEAVALSQAGCGMCCPRLLASDKVLT